MGRLPNSDVVTVVSRHVGHWQNLNAQTGSDFSPAPGITLPLLQTKFADWQTLSDEIDAGLRGNTKILYAERDAFLGKASVPYSPYFWLGKYKAAVQIAFPKASDPLRQTIPNLDKGRDAASLFRIFLAHWEKVNAALAPGELKLGNTFSRADLLTAQDGYLGKQAEIDGLAAQIPQWIAQRENLLGDTSADVRDPQSLVGILTTYHYGVETTPDLAAYVSSLPRIFPAQGGDKEIKFAYNWSETDTELQLWFEMPAESVNAATIWIKEGAAELSQPLPTAPPLQVTFENLLIVGEVDRVEMRDSNGLTVAFGRHKTDLPQPS